MRIHCARVRTTVEDHGCTVKGTVRANIKCPKVTVVTQYFCNINSRYYIAYYCVGDRTVRTKKTGQTRGRGVEACYEVQR